MDLQIFVVTTLELVLDFENYHSEYVRWLRVVRLYSTRFELSRLIPLVG